MKRGWILLLGLLAPLAAAIEDGVYELDANSKPARRVELNVTRGNLSSNSNPNDQWSLFVCYATKGALDGNQYAVVLDGKPFKVSIWGGSGEKEKNFSMELESRYVDAAKKLFAFEAFARRHPGHKLDVQFKPGKAAYKPGEPVTITMTVTNVGTIPFFFQEGEQNRGPRDDQFSFSCNGPDGTVSIKQASNFGGMSTIKEIAPGTTYVRKVELDRWMVLEKPGHYSLMGSFYVAIYTDVADMTAAVWTDYLTRPFYIEIKADPAK